MIPDKLFYNLIKFAFISFNKNSGTAFKNIFLIFTGILFYVNLSAQVDYDPLVQDRIKNVENSLVGWAQIKDNDFVKWKIIDRMKFYNVPAVSIAVINNGKIEWLKAYGLADKNENRKADVNTLFQAASVSKMINALGILKISEEHLIEIDEPVNIYLESYGITQADSVNGPVTIANLLSHTAGFNNPGFEGYEYGDTIPTLMQIINGNSPANNPPIHQDFKAGVKFLYSGGGVLISQKIIEDLLKISYDKWITKTVLNPLNMNSSSYDQPLPQEKWKLSATGYDVNGKLVSDRILVYPQLAAAGLWTTPSDLCQVLLTIVNSSKGKDSFIKQETAKRMISPFLEKGSSGLGTSLRSWGEQQYLYHTGANRGFRTVGIINIEEEKGAVVMINSDQFDFVMEIIKSISLVYDWKDYYSPQFQTPVPPPVSKQEDYEGVYETEDSLNFVITFSNNNYFITIGDDAPQKMYFNTEDEFFILEELSQCTFEKNAEGKITGINWKHRNGEFRLKKIN